MSLGDFACCHTGSGYVMCDQPLWWVMSPCAEARKKWGHHSHCLIRANLWLRKCIEHLNEFQIPLEFKSSLPWPLRIKSQDQTQASNREGTPKLTHTWHTSIQNIYSLQSTFISIMSVTFSMLLARRQSSVSLLSLQVRKPRLRQVELLKQVTQQSPREVLCFSFTGGHMFKVLEHKHVLSRNPWSQNTSEVVVSV